MSTHEPTCDFARFGEHVTHVQSYSGPKRSYTAWLSGGMKPDDPNRPGDQTELNFEISQRGAVCTCGLKEIMDPIWARMGQ